MSEVLLFFSSFALVFFLGTQSLNVNNGHYVAAFFTSFGIGASNLVLFKLAPDSNLTEMACFIMGGPFGIITSMLVHRKFIRRKPRREEIG